ncbi:sodium:proton antiporter [Acidobacteria bacterium AB60]|nr:sodium:proton antiporter [Acidobacteria bacterium AB60]
MSTLQIVSLIVAIAALFGWISTRLLRLPLTIGTMLLTVGASLILLDVGRFVPAFHTWASNLVQQIDFQSLVLNGMLPLLLFAGAFLLDLEQLWRERLPVSILAIVGTVLSFFAVAALMRLLSFGRASWIECLLFGALISPTDPIAVLEMLRRARISKAIESQLAGESLFNDGIGAVLFLTMIQIAAGHQPTAGHIAWLLLLQAGGAIVLGIAAAWLTSRLMCMVQSYQVDILLTLSLAFGGYLLALLGHLSGPLEAVIAGIALRHFNRLKPSGRIADDRVDEFWTLIDEVQNSLLFVLLGLEVLVVAFNPTTLRAGLAAILSVNAVRLAVVALCALLVRICRRERRSAIFTLTWGGLRGGLSIALALSIPPSLGGHWIFAATYLVVVFSILVQGGSLHLLMSRKQQSRKTTPAAA